MGLISGLCSALSSAASAFCGMVSSLASSIGGGVAKLASSIIPALAIPALPQIIVAIQVICLAVDVISTIIGLKEKDEKPEEIGMKAEIAKEEGITPEGFNSYQEYIDYLREKIALDREKITTLSDEARARYGIVGASILTKGIEEKEKISIPAEFLAAVGKQQLTPQETKGYIDTFKKENLNLRDFSNYLNGNLEKDMFKTIGRAIDSALKELYPDMTDREIYDKVTNMKNNART